VNETFALIKPDAVRRRLVGAILTRIEEHLDIADMTHLSHKQQEIREAVALLYVEHRGRTFYRELVDFITSGPMFALRLTLPNLEDDAVGQWRKLMGPTLEKHRHPGEIRYIYGAGCPVMENLVHGSDSKVAAQRELLLARRFGWLR
jgi:nucleoside-diphosphate kinase